MSDDIKKILARLDEALTPVSVKKGLNPQQRSVPQLPADFQPRKIRALGAAQDPRHPMTGLAVGAAESRTPTPAKTRNPVAKNAPRSGAGAHANKKRADRHGEVKHKKSAAADDEIKEMQHRPEQAVMILRRIPEGYRGARLYEKIMNTIIKRLGPAGSSSERRELYQTLAADVMERYIQKFPASAAVREDRADDVRVSDATDEMLRDLENVKIYQRSQDTRDRAIELLFVIRQRFLDTFQGRERASWLDDFLTPLDWCAATLATGTWNRQVMDETLDICITLLDEMNDRIWREIVPAKDDDEGGISVGDLSENYDEYANCYLSEGISEAMGLYGPFTVTINTGERPKSRTKTKKFRREDDAILWAENWLADAPQYVFATAEVTDPNGYVVWTTDESLEEQGVAEGLNEMDKSAPQPGRDGKVSHSTYGSRDKKGSDNFKGKEAPGKPITKKQMEKDALDILKKQGVAEGYNDISVGDYVSYDDGPGTDRWEVVSIQGNRVELRNDQGGTTFADINDVLKEQGVAEGSVTESGETYVWTADFADGSSERLRITTDEVPYARAAFEKKFPNKELVKVDTDWKPQDDGYGAMPASRYTEPRPSPDNPMVKEAWTLRGSKTRDNLEVKVYHDADGGRWALQMFVDGEYRPDQTQHFDSAQDAKEALRILMNFGLRESPAMKDLSEAIAEIEEDMLSKVRNDLTRYLDRLENKVKKDKSLNQKEPRVKEDPTAVDTMSVPPPAPVQNPVMPESVAVKSITLEDGSILEIHGDQLRGFEVRRGGRSLPTRFPNLDHAQMAVDLYRRRRGANGTSADYVEER